MTFLFIIIILLFLTMDLWFDACFGKKKAQVRKIVTENSCDSATKSDDYRDGREIFYGPENKPEDYLDKTEIFYGPENKPDNYQDNAETFYGPENKPDGYQNSTEIFYGPENRPTCNEEPVKQKKTTPKPRKRKVKA